LVTHEFDPRPRTRRRTPPGGGPSASITSATFATAIATSKWSVPKLGERAAQEERHGRDAQAGDLAEGR